MSMDIPLISIEPVDRKLAFLFRDTPIINLSLSNGNICKVLKVLTPLDSGI